MESQSQSKKQPEGTTGSSDQLEVSHSIEPPPIEDVLEKATNALSQAQKVKTRTHRCRSCHNSGCMHYERAYDDDGEAFNASGIDEKGRQYVDADYNNEPM